MFLPPTSPFQGFFKESCFAGDDFLESAKVILGKVCPRHCHRKTVVIGFPCAIGNSFGRLVIRNALRCVILGSVLRREALFLQRVDQAVDFFMGSGIRAGYQPVAADGVAVDLEGEGWRSLVGGLLAQNLAHRPVC